MEERVVRLELHVEHLLDSIKELRLDVRDLRQKVDTQFLILGGMIIGLAGLMAKGFHWIG